MSEQTAPIRTWTGRGRGLSKGERRREQLYEAAARLFYEKGYANTSLQDLADAVGLQKGSLYHYIDSKQDLLFGVTRYSHEFFTELVVSAAGESGSPSERLRETLFRHTKFAVENFHTQAAFYNERSNLSPDRQRAVLEIRDAYEHLLRDLVQQGRDTGEILASVEPKLAVFGLLGMINGINSWYRPDGQFDAETIADAFSDMALRSITAGS